MKKIALAIPFVLTLAAWAQHKPERDPFVNLASRPPVVHDTDVHVANTAITAQPHHQTSVAQTMKTPAPKLNVLGLVTNSSQPKAIVAGEKNTYIVAQGDSLGEYRVARIDRSGITLAYKQMRYHCPMGQ